MSVEVPPDDVLAAPPPVVAEASHRPPSRIGAAEAALAAAALLVLALAAERLWLLPLRISFNPNEGWNAFQAERAMGAGPLYPPPGSLTGDNYPPLSFLLIGGLARLTGGDPVVIGRAVATAGLLATAAAAAAAVRRLAPVRTWAPIVAALLVLSFAATQFRAYLAMNDPQWLAHALMTPALALLIPARAGEAPRPGRTAAAAALAVAGGLVKHNLLALPVAATLWLALHHRRALGVWLATGSACAVAALAVLTAAYGPDALRDILASPRHGSWLRMARAAAGPVLAMLPPLLACAPLLRLRRRDTRLDLPLLFIAVAVPLGVLQRSGQGVNFNAHFEALTAVAVGGGAALSHALAGGRVRAVRWEAALIAAPLVVLAPLAAAAAGKEAASVPPARADWAAMERRIAAVDGPVACETPALCFWAGRPFVMDTFLYGQRLATGGDGGALERALRDGRVAAVQLEAPRAAKAGDAPDPLPTLAAAHGALAFRGGDGRLLLVMRRDEPPARASACP